MTISRIVSPLHQIMKLVIMCSEISREKSDCGYLVSVCGCVSAQVQRGFREAEQEGEVEFNTTAIFIYSHQL